MVEWGPNLCCSWEAFWEGKILSGNSTASHQHHRLASPLHFFHWARLSDHFTTDPWAWVLPALTHNSPAVALTHSLYFWLPEKIFLPTSMALATSVSTENNELWWFVYREQSFRSSLNILCTETLVPSFICDGMAFSFSPAQSQLYPPSRAWPMLSLGTWSGIQ